MKQKELSVWLRIVVIVIGAAVLFLAVVFLPDIGQKAAQLNPELAYLYWPCLIFIWCTVLPMLAALALAWQIFTEIGRDNSFCLQNAQRLRKISVLALLDTLLYIGGFIALALLDAMRPGALVGTICIVFLGLIMTVISAALSHLTRKAADLKAENDLTI